MRRLIWFIRFIPAFYRFWKEWGLYPGYVDFALRQYIEVISKLTDGELTEPCYAAPYILGVISEKHSEKQAEV